MEKLNLNIKKIVFYSLLILIAISISFPANAIPFAGGNGTVGDPYQISTVDQLQNMSVYLSANYKLINDIDASGTTNWDSGAGFEPINKFAGTFDGQGHAINGLYINRPSTYHVGLFGYTLSSSKINNVGLVDVNITAHDYVGSLVGRSYGGSITRSYATGKVTGNNDVGGFVGYLDGGNLNQSYANVNVTGDDQVGGFVGKSLAGTITQSYSAGKVTGKCGKGGLVGVLYCGTITGSYWDLETSGQSTSAGCNGATGKTTDEMKTQSTYSGWDFTSVWNICNDAASS
ncbi:hypothetical protein HNV12_14225 [Methanococcoides sp. SA1]|nr:hypothetical protein [Methanococcoides sp. SA1]